MSVKIERSDKGILSPKFSNLDHQKVQKTDQNFMDMLKQEARDTTKEELEKMLLEVDQLGARLAEDLSLRTLKEYRDLVRRFIYLALKGAYSVEEEMGIDIFGSARSYKIVKKVDQSLEELASLMLKRHEAQLEIVSRVSEIRGLLVDLMG